jgi:hypothetical protein
MATRGSRGGGRLAECGPLNGTEIHIPNEDTLEAFDPMTSLVLCRDLRQDFFDSSRRRKPTTFLPLRCRISRVSKLCLWLWIFSDPD